MFTELDVWDRAVWSEAAFCHVSMCESCGLACVLDDGGTGVAWPVLSCVWSDEY